MIRIEIISVQQQTITAAFYYPVPPGKQSSAADDQSRTPAGNALDAQELQDLKDGKIIEVVRTIDPTSKNEASLRGHLASVWGQGGVSAQREYDQAYSYTSMSNLVGETWDGGQWS